MNSMAMPLFEHANPKIIEITFSFPEFALACKKICFFHLFIFEIQSILEFPYQTSTSTFDHAHVKKIWSAFNFCEFVSTCKKWGCFINLFQRNSWFEILQSDGLRTFWPISQKQHFSQICRNTAYNMHFHYRTNSVKINGHIFDQTLFLVHFSNVWGEKSSSKNHTHVKVGHTSKCKNSNIYNVVFF